MFSRDFRQRQHIVEGALRLVLVELGGVEIIQAVGGILRRLVGVVRDLIARDGRPGDETQLRGVVDRIGREAEESPLPRPIMQSFVAGRWILKAEIVHGQATGGEYLPRADLCAIFERGLTGRVAAAIETDAAAGRRWGRAGYDVDKARRAEPILRGQRARDQRQRADKACIHHLPETGHAVGQENAVYAILDIAVLVADMKIAACRRVLRDAGALQEDLVDCRLIALRQGLDGLAIEGVNIRADFRQQPFKARLPFVTSWRLRRGRGKLRRSRDGRSRDWNWTCRGGSAVTRRRGAQPMPGSHFDRRQRLLRRGRSIQSNEHPRRQQEGVNAGRENLASALSGE